MLGIYHVTNIPATQKPTWKHVQTSVLRDAMYDGTMVGLETAAFSSTLIKGALPRRSTYPTGAPPRTMWWRASAVVNLIEYHVFFMHEHTTQQSRVLCRRDDAVESDFANALASAGFRELVGPHYNTFLPNGCGNEFNNSLWVNLHFLSFVRVSAWRRCRGWTARARASWWRRSRCPARW